MHMLVANWLSDAFSDAYSDAKFNAFESQPRVAIQYTRADFGAGFWATFGAVFRADF